MHKHSEGFAHILAILLIVVVLGALGFVGYSAFRKSQTASTDTVYSDMQKNVDADTSTENALDIEQQNNYAATSTSISNAASTLDGVSNE